MPRQKDLKRLVRSRIRKTGESYTTARAQLLRKRQPAAAPAPARPTAPPLPDDYQRLAGMSDAAGAVQMPHRQIADVLSKTHGTPGWWTQMLTVGYERIRGLRDVGQRRGSGYEATKSRTFPVPVAEVYRAWANDRVRRRWLTGDHTVTRATADKSMRLRFADGTPADVRFTARPGDKSQVAVQHEKLPSRDAAAERKRFWAEALDALARELS